MTKASELLKDVCDAYVIGDSAYSSRALVEQLTSQRCTPLLATNPTHKSRKDDPSSPPALSAGLCIDHRSR